MTSLLRATTLLLLISLLLPASTPAAGRVVGALLTSDLHRYREAHRYLLKVLGAHGYLASSEILLQTPNPDPQSWANSVRKLTAYGADIIVAYGAPAVASALREGDETPVVAVDAVLPEGPLPDDLCGISGRVPMVTLLRVMQEIRHRQRVGVLYNSREVGSQRQLDDLRRAARQMHLTLVEGNVSRPQALDPVTSSLLGQANALIVTESSVVCRQFDRIIARAHNARVPVATTMPDGAARGALVSLETSPAEQGEVAGQMTVRLLEGMRPAQLGIVTPRRIDLVLNLKVAREHDATVPFHVLDMATRILK